MCSHPQVSLSLSGEAGENSRTRGLYSALGGLSARGQVTVGHCHQNHCYLTALQQWHLLKKDKNHDKVQDTGTLRWGAPGGCISCPCGTDVCDWTQLGHSGLPAPTSLSEAAQCYCVRGCLGVVGLWAAMKPRALIGLGLVQMV